MNSLIILPALLLTGCAPTMYDLTEHGRTAACETLHGQEYEDCMAQAKKSYEVYEQEREQE